MTVEQVAALMADFDAPWWVAGGWAIDLFLGRKTREHADLDIAILRADQPALARLLAGWDVQVATGGVLTPWRPGDWLEGGVRHQFWARLGPTEPWAIEILLEEGDRDRWTYRRDDRISLPLPLFGAASASGVPCVAPEVALLYKAGGHGIPRNAADFETAAPSLAPERRVWLAQALRLTDRRHPWVERLQPAR